METATVTLYVMINGHVVVIFRNSENITFFFLQAYIFIICNNHKILKLNVALR
jgi:hypothetical protein